MSLRRGGSIVKIYLKEEEWYPVIECHSAEFLKKTFSTHYTDLADKCIYTAKVEISQQQLEMIEEANNKFYEAQQFLKQCFNEWAYEVRYKRNEEGHVNPKPKDPTYILRKCDNGNE